MPAIRPGWRAASAHDTAARATIRQGRAGLGVLGRPGRACWGTQGGRRMGAGRRVGADRRAAGRVMSA